MTRAVGSALTNVGGGLLEGTGGRGGRSIRKGSFQPKIVVCKWTSGGRAEDVKLVGNGGQTNTVDGDRTGVSAVSQRL